MLYDTYDIDVYSICESVYYSCNDEYDYVVECVNDWIYNGYNDNILLEDIILNEISNSWISKKLGFPNVTNLDLDYNFIDNKGNIVSPDVKNYSTAQRAQFLRSALERNNLMRLSRNPDFHKTISTLNAQDLKQTNEWIKDYHKVLQQYNLAKAIEGENISIDDRIAAFVFSKKLKQEIEDSEKLNDKEYYAKHFKDKFHGKGDSEREILNATVKRNKEDMNKIRKGTSDYQSYKEIKKNDKYQEELDKKAEEDRRKSEEWHRKYPNGRKTGRFISKLNTKNIALGVGLGAAAIGGGIYAYKQYKNRPRSVIAKRIAALRGIYKKFMVNAQRNPQKANIFKRMAAKILSVIDKLMAYMQNAAG